MEILIAEDNPAFLRILDNMVRKWDYQSILVPDGAQAWEILQRADPPRLAILMTFSLATGCAPATCAAIASTARRRVEGMEAGATITRASL